MKRLNFDLAELIAFIAVAEKASFKAAAEELFLSQPALSRRVEKLETTLGVRLLERTTRKVELTVIGRLFLDHARTAIDELENAILGISDLAVQRSGQVAVACVPSAAYYFLPAVLRTFAVKYPRIRVKLIDEGANEVLASVISGAADFGLNFTGIQDPEIDFKAINREKFVLAIPRDHRWANRKSVDWEELVDEAVISVSKASGNRVLVDNALSGLAKRPSISFEVNHVAGALGLVEAGLGVAAVPQLALPTHPRSSLIGIPLMRPTVSRTLGLITRHGKVLAPAAQMLYNMLRKSV